MWTYSFKDVTAVYAGPGGTFQLGDGSGASEEGLTIDFIDDKGAMTIGAGGEVMHSLHAGKAATLTVRLLKTSPTNFLLSRAYNIETASSALFGVGTLVIRNPVTGDIITCRQVGFKKQPPITYAKDGGSNEWVFNCGLVDQILGIGAPEIANAS